MKLVDFRCTQCDEKVELVEPSGERLEPRHCDTAMLRMIGAPHVTGTRLYSKHYVGQEANAREIEKAMKKDNSWVPTPKEAKEFSEMSDAGMEPIKVTPPSREKVQRAVEKAYAKMKQEKLDTRVQ